MPSLLRSMVAVIVGFMVMMLVVIALTLVMVKTMGLQSGHPTPGYLALNVAASFFAAFVGGYTTGSIAAERRVRHGYLLAMVMLLMAALSYVHYQGAQPAVVPGDDGGRAAGGGGAGSEVCAGVASGFDEGGAGKSLSVIPCVPWRRMGDSS